MLSSFKRTAMSLTWRSRFFLLLIPSVLGLLFFLYTRTDLATSRVASQTFGTSSVHWSPPNTSPDSSVVSSVIEEESDGTAPLSILLVSAFFPLSKSKHTMRDYETWLSNFLQPIITDVYFYTSPEMESLVRKCRGALPITVNTTYATPFEIPPLNTSRERYFEMHSLDREKERHSPELYAVWAAKPFFLDEAVQTFARTGKQYDYAFWTDAGSFRTKHTYVAWPGSSRVRQIWKEGSALTGEKEEDLLFFPAAGMPHPSMKYWTQDHGPIDAEFSEGKY